MNRRSLPVIGSGRDEDRMERPAPKPSSAAANAGAPSTEMESALEEIWDETRRQFYRPRNFLRWLDLNRRFQLRFIRAEQLRIEVPGALLPDCDNCLDICCTGPNAVVTLRLQDIARLVDAGLQDAIVFADTAPLPQERAKSWAQRNLDASLFRHTFPVLKRDDTGTCSLLTPERHCGAWPAWPLSCARYPYSVDVEHNVLFLAKGCESHKRMSRDDAPDSIRRLIDAAIESYNARVKDVILLHCALDELDRIGLVDRLRLPPRLQKRLGRLRARRESEEAP